MKRILAWFLCLVMVFTMAPMDFGSFAGADEVSQEETQTDLAETEEAEEPEEIFAEEEIAVVENPEPAVKEKEGPAAESERKPEPKKEENILPAAEEQKTEPAPEEEKEELTEAPSAEEENPADETSDAAETEEEPPVQEPEDGTEAEEQTEVSETPEAKPEDGKTEPSEEEKKEEKPSAPEEPADQAPEEAGFQAGYVRIKAGEKLYKDPFCSQLLGVLQEEAVAYAVEQDEQTGNVSVVLSAEGNAVAAWLGEEKAEALTEAETERQENTAEDLFWAGRAKLTNVQIALNDEASTQNELQEEADPAEEGFSEGEPTASEGTEMSGEEAAPEETEEEEEEIVGPTDDETEHGSGVIYGEGGFLIPEIRSAPYQTGEALVAKDYVSPPAEFLFYPINGEIYPLWKGTAGCYYEMQKKENDGDWTILNQYMYCQQDNHYYYGDSKTLGRAYQYRIRAFDSSYTSHSSWVYISVFYTDTISASAKVDSKTAVPTVKWGKAKGATGYYIYRKTTNRNTGKAMGWKLVKKISGNKTFSYADKDIAINRHYDYEIVPVRKAGKKTIGAYSDYTGKTSANVRPLSGAPENAKAKQVKNGVKLTWKKVTGASAYTIYYSNNPYAAKPTWKKLTTTKKTSYTHKDKIKASTSGKYRQYRIYPTAKIKGKTKKGPVAYTSIIKRLAGTTVKLQKGKAEDTVVVSWKKVKGANLYRIYFKLDGENSYRYGEVSGSYTAALLTGAHNITGTKKNLVYVVPVSTSNKTGKTQVGSKSATKSIKPTWTYVVIVGNDNYPGTEKDLPGIKYDVPGMKAVFQKRGATRITTGRNKTASEIKSMISRGFSGAGENSICVLVYAGHGYDGSGGLSCPGNTSLPAWELKDYLDSHVNSRHVVFIHQACSSGGVIGKGTNEKEEAEAAERRMVNAILEPFMTVGKNGEFRDPNYTVIAAAKCWTNAWAVWEWNSSSIITNGFSPMLRFLAASGGYDYYSGSTGLKGDKNKDGRTSVKEAYNYARPKVKNFYWYGKEYSSTMVGYFPEPDLPLF